MDALYLLENKSVVWMDFNENTQDGFNLKPLVWLL